MFLLLVCIVLVILLLCKVYAIFTRGKCTSKKNLHGKTALVTGSNRGIGYYTALDLARRGSRVIIASENKKGLDKARDRIIQKTGNNNVVAKYLDLSSLDIVRAFAKGILDTEERLDILVNNAGIYGRSEKYTKDGLLQLMQVNYFGPFLLTNLLLGLMKKSAPSRIVNVSSCLSQVGLFFDPNNINTFDSKFLDIFNQDILYCNSKRCVIYTTMEMASRLAGSDVTVNSVHPGAVHTNILYDHETPRYHLVMIAVILARAYFKTTEQGAQTSIHVAVSESEEGVSGKYFSDCRQTSWWAPKSQEIQRKIWDQTVKLVKLSPEEMHYDQ